MNRSLLNVVILFCVFSCNKFYNKIEVKNGNIEDVRNSMERISYLLDKKVVLDSLTLTSRIEILKKNDTIGEDVGQYYYFWKYDVNQRMGIYLSRDNSIFLNYVVISKNINEFSKNINTYKDFYLFTDNEKQEFLSSYKNLMNNDIWSCSEDRIGGFSFYVFSYSKDNLYYSSDSQRYLFLEKDIEHVKDLKEFQKKYQFLYKKDDIVLYKGVRISNKW
jgi:hypothetical protein